MTDGVISYSRRDIAFARVLHRALQQDEIDTWIDWQDIPPSDDGTQRVWDAETGQELVVLSGHGDRVRQAEWNADETRILTRSDDGTVRQSYTRMDDLLRAACRRAPRNLTDAEWETCFVGTPCQVTCPGSPDLCTSRRAPTR